MNENEDLGGAAGAGAGGGDSFLTTVLGLGLSLAAAALAAMEVPGFLEAETNVENTLAAGFDGATTLPLGFPAGAFTAPFGMESDALAPEVAASPRLRSAA